MPIVSVKGWTPRIDPSAFIAGGAQIIGDVSIAEDVSVWFNAVIRADTASITIGAKSNVQDCCLVHADEGQPTVIGKNVIMGHGAVVHAATIGDNVLIGINSVILNRAKVGEGSIIGAGAVVTEDSDIPPYSLVLGIPAKVVKQLSPEESARMAHGADGYVEKSREYKRSMKILPELRGGGSS